MNTTVDAIHRYWFGRLDDAGLSGEDHRRLWFSPSDSTDQYLRQQFGATLDQALAGELDDWADSDHGLIALVVVLDQFSRNIHRGTAAAFAGDPAALALARQAIASGRYQRLPAIHQVFLYLPLEHCEDLEIQEQCVRLFEQLATVTGSAAVRDFGRYAIAHRDVIAQFGRFPHRNAILGRTSSAGELAHLKEHGGF